jgi:hypothetical protein
MDLATICKELKIEPRAARIRLRKSGVKKPKDGWVWEKGPALSEARAIIKGSGEKPEPKAKAPTAKAKSAPKAKAKKPATKKTTPPKSEPEQAQAA